MIYIRKVIYQNKVNFSLDSFYSPLLPNYTLGIILVKEMLTMSHDLSCCIKLKTESWKWLLLRDINHFIYFFSRLLNIAKSCGRLLPPEKGKVFLPCHSTFESSCRRGCVDGYFAVGDNVATCRLTNSSEVAWDMGAFSCEGLYWLIG